MNNPESVGFVLLGLLSSHYLRRGTQLCLHVRRFTASITCLNNLMAQHMKLPTCRINTSSVPKPLSDDAEHKHKLVLYWLAYLVATHAIPLALVVSRDQGANALCPFEPTNVIVWQCLQWHCIWTLAISFDCHSSLDTRIVVIADDSVEVQ